MNDYEKTAHGVVLTIEDKIYFIPERVLEGFSVKHPIGQDVLRKATGGAEQHDAFIVAVDRSQLHQVYIF